MRARFVLSEMAIGLRRNLTLTIAVIITVATSLSLFGVGLLLRDEVSLVKGYWYDKVEVSVFMCGQSSLSPNCKNGVVTPAEQAVILSTLKALPAVEKIYYESSQEALVHYKQWYANDPALIQNVTASALPSSFRVKLYNPADYAVVETAVGGLPGVDLVNDEHITLSKVFRVMDAINLTMAVLALVNLGAAIILIAIAVRVAAFSRRRETGIMRLVGASNLYIQLPFVLEGAFAGLVGSVTAMGGIYLSWYYLFHRILPRDIQGVLWIPVNSVWNAAPIILGLGVGLSALASFITIRRYLRV